MTLTSTVSKYCSIKYQTWDPMSMSKNWKPAGVMEGMGSTPSLSITKKDITTNVFIPKLSNYGSV